VNGPNGKDVFDAGGLGDYQDGMVRCPANGRDAYAAFNGHGSRYVDDVRAWETDEPALDMTAAAIAASAANLS
jgi:endoglucanase